MQTFLPYADFAETARVLDPKRLGNQRTEALGILRVCNIETLRLAAPSRRPDVARTHTRADRLRQGDLRRVDLARPWRHGPRQAPRMVARRRVPRPVRARVQR